MNKSVKRLVSVLLAMLVLSALSVGALADDGSYTVTVSTGNIEGAVLLGESSHTAQFNEDLPLGTVEVPEDSPYFFKGFRPAGQDNSVIYPSTVTVTEDCDYVAAYGLRGELVAYTIQYVTEDGTELVSSETHYGNQGDKMVVRARNFDGYQPQAYQLAKTLVENESENVFPFVYSRVVIVNPTPAPSPTPYVYTEGGGTVDAGTTEIGGGTAPAGGGEAAPAPGGGEEAEPAPAPEEQEPAEEQQTEQITEDDTPLNQGPAEIIDLDDTPSGETPEIKEKPKTDLQQERAENETKLYVAGGLLAAALAAIVVLVVLLVKKRRA